MSMNKKVILGHLILWSALGIFILNLHLYEMLSGNYRDLQRALNAPNLVTQLDLSNQNLTSLPPEIGQLQRLKTLRISYNKLTTLPEAICDLNNLQVLKAGYNQLESLPECMGYLSELRELRLGFNQLLTLPNTFNLLEDLERLHVGYNQFEVVPKVLFELTQLQHLGLNGMGLGGQDLYELKAILFQTKIKADTY